VFNPTVPFDNWQSTNYDGCGYSIRNRATVNLYDTNALGVAAAQPFRTIARQGGFNGCLEYPQCDPYAFLQCPNSTNNRVPFKKRDEFVIEQYGYFDTAFNGNSYYTVLCNRFQVDLNEYGLGLNTTVDCRPGGMCTNTIPLISNLEVDTRCNGGVNNAYGSPYPLSGASIQLTDNAIFTTNASALNYSGIGFDITLYDQNGVQFRGKRSKIFFANCTFNQWAWSSATCVDCGYRDNCFSVLAAPAIEVKVSELPYRDRPVQYPDQRVYPVNWQTVNCSNGNIGCSTNLAKTFSWLNVLSQRGAPSSQLNGIDPYVAVKFGNVVQTGLRYIHESWLYTDGTINHICVIADARPQYALNWGPIWASNNAGNLFADCSPLAVSSKFDACRNPGSLPPQYPIVVPPTKKKSDK
jgi:hypothetical protein